jgi:hypothetical protein
MLPPSLYPTTNDFTSQMVCMHTALRLKCSCISHFPIRPTYTAYFIVLDPTVHFFYLVCEAIGTVATPGLLCQPRVIMKMIVEKQIECRLAGETEVLRENLPQRHFCPSQNPT